VSLKQLLEEMVQDDRIVKPSSLSQLSGLSPSDVGLVSTIWKKFEPNLRIEFLTLMVGMAEEDVELNFNPVFKFALKDDSPEVREAAISGLWECEERSLLSIYITLLQKDPSEEVRAAAALGLRKFVVLAESNKLLTNDAIRVRKSLMDIVNSSVESLNVRRRSVEALSPFSDESIKELIRWAYHHESPKMRESAVFSMGFNSDPGWVPIIINEFSNSDPAMRYEAVCASGRMGEEMVIPQLVTLLNDDDLQVRLSTITALGFIGGSLAKRVLVSCLNHEDESILETTQAALEALEANEDPLAFEYKL